MAKAAAAQGSGEKASAAGWSGEPVQAAALADQTLAKAAAAQGSGEKAAAAGWSGEPTQAAALADHTLAKAAAAQGSGEKASAAGWSGEPAQAAARADQSPAKAAHGRGEPAQVAASADQTPATAKPPAAGRGESPPTGTASLQPAAQPGTPERVQIFVDGGGRLPHQEGADGPRNFHWIKKGSLKSDPENGKAAAERTRTLCRTAPVSHIEIPSPEE